MVDALVSVCCRKLARRLQCATDVLRVGLWQVPVKGRRRGHGRDVEAATSSTAAPWPPSLSPYVAVAALAALVYWNSVHGQFVHDDVVAVVKNDDIRPHSPLVDILRHDFWGRSIDSERSHKSYRPLCVATFRSDDYTQRAVLSFYIVGRQCM